MNFRQTLANASSNAYLAVSDRPDIGSWSYQDRISGPRTAVYNDGSRTIMAHRGTVWSDCARCPTRRRSLRVGHLTCPPGLPTCYIRIYYAALGGTFFFVTRLLVALFFSVALFFHERSSLAQSGTSCDAERNCRILSEDAPWEFLIRCPLGISYQRWCCRSTSSSACPRCARLKLLQGRD